LTLSSDRYYVYKHFQTFRTGDVLGEFIGRGRLADMRIPGKLLSLKVIQFMVILFSAWIEKIYRPTVWCSKTFSSVKVYGYSHASIEIEQLGIKRKHRALESGDDVFHEQFLI